MRTEIEVFKTRAWIEDETGAWSSTDKDVAQALNLETISIRNGLSYEPFLNKAIAEEIVRRYKGKLISLEDPPEYDPNVVY